MLLKTAIIQGFRILSNPDKEFKEINNRTLEKVLEDYIKLLLASGLLATVVSFVFIIVYSTYLNIFRGVNIGYWHLINYAAGISGSIFFFYLFAGTFLFFLISLIVKLFVPRLKYTKLIAIICYSLSPILLFGWISTKLVLALCIWSIFLLIVGIKQAPQREDGTVRAVIKKNKTSGKERRKAKRK